jgi:hypothetical protein
VVHRTFALGDQAIGIRTTSPSFGAWLDDVLAPYPVPEAADADFSIVVGDTSRASGRRDLHILYWGTSPIVRTLDLRTVGAALLTALESFRLPHRDDAIYVDASLVALDGVVGLLPPAVPAFLERLGRRPERAGLRLPGFTFVAVDPDTGTVGPFRPLLDVPVDALDRLPNGNEGRHFFVDQATRVDAVGTIVDGYGAIVHGTGPAVTLHNLAKSTFNLPRLGETALHGLAKLVERATCYAIAPIATTSGILDALVMALRDTRSLVAAEPQGR